MPLSDQPQTPPDFQRIQGGDMRLTADGIEALWQTSQDTRLEIDRMRSGVVVDNLNADTLDGRDESAFALLAGRAGGQTLIGGTASGEDLTLQSTANATRGSVFFGSAQTTAYDEVNNRLGIAVAGPLERLHVDGNIRLGTTVSSGTNTISRSDVSSGDGENLAIVGGNAVFSTGTPHTGGDLLLDGGNEASAGADGNVLIATTNPGKVGVGTASPDALLEIESSAATTILQISNAAADGDPALAFALSGTKTFTMGVDDGDGDKFKIGTTVIDTNTRLTIDSSGNVGIGTTNPLQKLVVSDGGANGLEIAPASGLIQAFNRSTAAYTALNLDGLSIQLRPSGTAKLTVNSTGAVDIGDRVRFQADGNVMFDADGSVGDHNAIRVNTRGAWSPGTDATFPNVWRDTTVVTLGATHTSYSAVGLGTTFGSSVTTAASTAMTQVATMALYEPNITLGSGGSITTASTLYIASAPTEGTNNYALFVDAGLARFDGDATHVFQLPADATDPTGGGGAATGRIPVTIGGVTRYLAYY